MITRFAPSPTGYLHIGGVRTALFNWALARQSQGKFYLRIDDTDMDRHVEDATQKIVDGLEWLGMDYDVPDHLQQGMPGHIGAVTDFVRQSQRGHVYQDYCITLLEKGLAYKCFCSEEELSESKKRQGPGYKYLGTCRDFTEVEQSRIQMLRGGSHCIRLNVGKLVKSGELLSFDDLVLGKIEQKDEIGDPVIFRNTGVPVYNMATVIDDVEMKISHIVRGMDHITNTFIQMLLYRAIDFQIPQFAHLPLICAPATRETPQRKLSKRDSTVGFPTTLEEYRDLGYYPDALVNYLTHLGWSMDGKTEKWSTKKFVENFSLKRVMKSAACFDIAKLKWLQGEYMKKLLHEDKVALVMGDIKNWEPSVVNDDLIQMVDKIVMSCGDRLNILSDFHHYRHFIDDRFFSCDLKAVEQRVKPRVEHLAAIHDMLTVWDDWTHDGLEKIIREYCETAEVKPAHMIHALRVATTGTMQGFGMYEGMEMLGKVRCLQRIASVIKESTKEQV